MKNVAALNGSGISTDVMRPRGRGFPEEARGMLGVMNLVGHGTWRVHDLRSGPTTSDGRDRCRLKPEIRCPVRQGGRPGAGFDPEQRFSNGNDWEPHVAADPGSTFVYMVTTGRDAKECLQCPEPSIIYRISPDSGSHWGPGKFVCGALCGSNNIAGPWRLGPTA